MFLAKVNKNLVLRPSLAQRLSNLWFSSSSNASNDDQAKIAAESSKKGTKKSIIEDVPDKDTYWEYHQKDLGRIYDKKPIKVNVKEGKIYMWCSCGWSKSQPFCDGSHKNRHWKTKLQPVPWTAQETKEVWFCACKQTKHRPFCDGTNKEPHVQEATDSVIKYWTSPFAFTSNQAFLISNLNFW